MHRLHLISFLSLLKLTISLYFYPDPNTALSQLCKGNPGPDIADFQDMLRHPDVNVSSNSSNTGWTCLHWTARRDRADVMDLLMTSKTFDVGNVNTAATNNRETPLHMAAYKGSTSAAMRLLAAGASRDVLTAGGETPADMARSQGHDVLADTIEGET